MSVLTITNENFEAEVLNSKQPVLLDFWAPWCGPCRMIGPIVDEIASEQTAVKVGKIDVNDAPQLAAQFGVMSIPLLVLVNNGETVAQLEGYNPNQKAMIIEMLAPYMKKALSKGQVGTATTTVTNANTAKAVGSGSLDVFATPMMVALMEEAACNCTAAGLEPGQSSVGTAISVNHLAASPLGVGITATATLEEVDGRKLTFTLSAYEGEKEIGNGTHTRFLVDVERFMGKIIE